MRLKPLFIVSILIISTFFILASFNAQHAKAGIPNGTTITSVSGTYATSQICFDGAFYYVFYESATNLYYAYATNPLGTWSIKEVSAGGGTYTWSVNCGENGAANLLVYGVSYSSSGRYMNITSFQGGNIGNTNPAIYVAGAEYGSSVGVFSIDNFYKHGGIPGQLPYPVDALVWVGMVDCFGLTVTCVLSVVALYPPTTGNWGAGSGGNIATTSNGYFEGAQLYDNNGLPAMVYSCDSAVCSNTGKLGLAEIQMNKIINQTAYYWDTPISPNSYDYNVAFSTVNYNSNINVIGDCYQTSYSGNPCYYNNIVDYWTFNLIDQNWTKTSSNIAGSLTDRAFQLNVDLNTGIVRSYYYNSSSIQYFYPVNETGSTVHVGYLSSGDTIDAFTLNQYSQGGNYYYAYTVSSTTPHLLKWASYTTQPSLSTTITRVTYVTNTITPSLSKCTNTNSCTTNQFSQFMVVLLPSIIFIAIGEFFTFKIGVKDERIYVMIFMFIISGVGFLSALGGFGNNGIPWYIPIFSDIIGFMLILTFKGNSGGM